MFNRLGSFFLLSVAVIPAIVATGVDASAGNCSSRLDYLEEEYRTLKTDYSQLSDIVRKLDNGKPIQGKREVQLSVAFTAYIGSDVRHIGINQAVPYNRVASNIGNAFNIHTHVFTAPITGIYLFTFVISEYSQSEMVAKLVVDGQNIIDAITNPVAAGHDQQGVNSAVLQVNKGQSVWVVNYFQNDVHVRSDENYRFASFSGVLINEI